MDASEVPLVRVREHETGRRRTFSNGRHTGRNKERLFLLTQLSIYNFCSVNKFNFGGVFLFNKDKKLAMEMKPRDSANREETQVDN